MEMKQGLFLYRIFMPSDYLSVDQGIKYAVPVFPYSAYTPFTWIYRAVLTAEMTFDFTVPDLVVEHRFLHGVTPSWLIIVHIISAAKFRQVECAAQTIKGRGRK
jgi:hypothetical protein